MKPVDEIQRVNERLLFWQGYEPAVKTDLCAHACLTPAGWVLIDPISVQHELLDEMQEGKEVAGIVITSVNHERAAKDFKARTGAPIFAHEEGRGEMTLKADRWVRDGDEIAGLRVAHLLGFARGEIALHASGEQGMLLLGDALINLPSYGFAMLPEKYCSDAKEATRSLRKLLQFQFEIMTFAHGLPITSGARQKLEKLLQ